MVFNLIIRKVRGLLNLNNLTYLKLFFYYFLFGRNKAFSVRLDGIRLHTLDSWSLIGMYNEIFRQNIYDFESDNPTVIDCGSNIGLASAYLLKKFPKASIVCIEPDPDIFHTLQSNLKQFIHAELQFYNNALWKEGGKVLKFNKIGDDSGSLLGQGGNTIEVSTITLSSVLDKYEKVDFLKIDIEGVENEVIIECEEGLHKVKRIFVEYHSYKNSEQKLSSILNILERNNFRYTMMPARKVSSPFRNELKSSKLSCDFQINIFAEK